MTNIEFLKKHSYSTGKMTEDDATNFILEQADKRVLPFKYMKNRAKQIRAKKGLNMKNFLVCYIGGTNSLSSGNLEIRAEIYPNFSVVTTYIKNKYNLGHVSIINIIELTEEQNNSFWSDK